MGDCALGKAVLHNEGRVKGPEGWRVGMSSGAETIPNMRQLLNCVRLGIADSVAPADDCLWIPAVGKAKPWAELFLVQVQTYPTRRTGKYQSSRNAISGRVGHVAVKPTHSVIFLVGRLSQVIPEPQV